MIYAEIIILILLLIALGYAVHKIYTLKKAIKEFSPVRYVAETNLVQIGKTDVFTDEKDTHLAQYKEVLRLIVAKIDYRIATYTTIQNTCYRPRGHIGEQILHELKSDSEKWMETGRMNGYIDIRADIEHLIAKEPKHTGE